MKIRKIRPIIQITAVGLFLYLFMNIRYPVNVKLPLNLFFKMSANTALINILSGGEIKKFYLALIIIIFTTIFGRFYCGWICPLGAYFDLFKKFKFKIRIYHLHKLKYFLLLLFMLLTLLGLPLLWLLDPNVILNSFLVFVINKQIPVIFILVTSLAFFTPRFFCQNLCPLGAILGTFASFRRYQRKVNQKICTSCGKCYNECPMSAIDKNFKETNNAECILCFNCVNICENKAVEFKIK